MCAMHMMCKIGTVCIRVSYTYFIFDRIFVSTIPTHMCRILPEDLALALKQLFSFFPVPFLPTLLSWDHM